MKLTTYPYGELGSRSTGGRTIHAAGCPPTCRVQEPARAASRGDPIEGELPRARSLANGTEPYLANPHNAFMYESSDHEPTLIERGMGVHLNHPIIARRGIRDPIDGGCGNLTLRPAKGRRGSVQNKSESSPRSLRTGLGSGARRTATPPRVHRTQAVPVMCMWYHRGRLEHCRCRLKLTPRTLVYLVKNLLQERSRSCRASGARHAGPLTRPHGIALATRREERPISERQHL
jgi:hypothetical protein